MQPTKGRTSAAHCRLDGIVVYMPPRCRSKALPACAVGGGLPDNFSQPVHIAATVGPSGFALTDQVGTTADLIADDRWQTRRHRFIDHQSPGFTSIGRQEQQIGSDV